jgi:DNA-binding MarR family transcriptional regulator
MSSHPTDTASERRSARKPRKLDYGLLPTLLGYQVRQAQIAIFRDFTATLTEAGMTPTLYGALVLIDSNPDLKQTELARAIQLDRSTVVTVIDTLQKRHLVARRRTKEDRRSNALSLTEAGTALLAELTPQVVEHEQRLVEHLTPDETATLAQALRKIFPGRR